MPARSYRDLDVWQKSMDFVVACYQATENFPKHELYGLANQLRRAAGSVPANIAEGQGRRRKGYFKHFLNIACGSLAETETHIIIAQRLNYIRAVDCDRLLRQSAEVGRMLNGLLNSLELPTTSN